MKVSKVNQRNQQQYNKHELISYVYLSVNKLFQSVFDKNECGDYKEYNYYNLKEERIYRFGKIEGTVKIYYDNLKIMEEGNYKNGVRDGISRWYDQDGKVSIEYEYKNGELVKK